MRRKTKCQREICRNNSPKLIKSEKENGQIQQVQYTPTRINPKKCTSHIIIKLPNVTHKGRMLKAAGEK